MSEELKEPEKQAPQAIILSVYLGAVTGFIFLISAFFCVSTTPDNNFPESPDSEGSPQTKTSHPNSMTENLPTNP